MGSSILVISVQVSGARHILAVMSPRQWPLLAADLLVRADEVIE